MQTVNKKSEIINLFIFGLIAALAILSSYQRRWITDDAFISFRYASNLIEGRGFVFNAGERVEGYTNFLWTLVLAIGLKLGIEPEGFSIFLGIACYAALLLLLFLKSRKFRDPVAHGNLHISIAAAGAAALLHNRIFATSGLEVAFFILIVTYTMFSAIEAATPRKWLVTGILGTIATLTRPDGLIFYGLAISSSLLSNIGWKARWKQALIASLPGILLLTPYFIWKKLYYGDFLPNTFYAKAQPFPSWSQGYYYIRIFFELYWPLWIGWIALVYLIFRRIREPIAPGWNGLRAPLILFAAVNVYLLYVLRVGGDFMFARFCLPIVPLLFIAMDCFASSFKNRIVRWVMLATVVSGLLLARFPSEFNSILRNRGIVEESIFYPYSSVHRAKNVGNCLKAFTHGTDTRVVAYGRQLMLAYYAEFPVVIEGETGLTDRKLARMPVQSTRIGHSRKAPVSYLRERGINLVFGFPEEFGDIVFNDIDFGCVRGRIICYRKDLMYTLRSRGARFVDFENYLDEYIKALPGKTPAVVADDFGKFRLFYFQYNQDPAREDALKAFLLKHRQKIQ